MGGESAWGGSFPDEINPQSPLYQGGYRRGMVAMANAGPNTNGSQFFIVYADSSLPASYTVFGHVDDAAVKTVEDVAKKGVVGGQGDGAPKEAVTISSVSAD
jgi:peptidyl-prolyl cis-trans isomerase B (cyclophilin B)